MARCEVCGLGEREQKDIRYTLLNDDEPVVVEGVPASICNLCGEASLAPEVVDQLQQTIWRGRHSAKKMKVMVYELREC